MLVHFLSCSHITDFVAALTFSPDAPGEIFWFCLRYKVCPNINTASCVTFCQTSAKLSTTINCYKWSVTLGGCWFTDSHCALRWWRRSQTGGGPASFCSAMFVLLFMSWLPVIHFVCDAIARVCGCVLVSAPPGSVQQADDQFLSRIFIFVAFVFIFWLMIAWRGLCLHSLPLRCKAVVCIVGRYYVTVHLLYKT